MKDKESMKILVVSNMGPSIKAPNYGVFIQNFCKQLDELGIEYNWIYIKKSFSKISKLSRYLMFFLTTIFKCWFGKYEYVYVHYLSISSIPVLIAGKVKKFRIIANAHGSDLVPENHVQKKYQKYTRRIIRASEKIVVPSEYFKDYLQKKYSEQLQNQNIYVYPSGGIDEHIFYPMDGKELEQAFKKYALSQQKIYIGYCGRITKNKGIHTLLMAIPAVLREMNVEFIFVGSGDYEEEMKSLSKEMGIIKNLHFYTMMTQEQLREIYNIISLFIFPTEREGESLGLVALEAMACGTPVIASDFAAPKYYVQDGFNGFRFEMANSKSLAERMICAMRDTEQLQYLKSGAIQTARTYGTGETKKILEKVFE